MLVLKEKKLAYSLIRPELTPKFLNFGMKFQWRRSLVWDQIHDFNIIVYWVWILAIGPRFNILYQVLIGLVFKVLIPL